MDSRALLKICKFYKNVGGRCPLTTVEIEVYEFCKDSYCTTCMLSKGYTERNKTNYQDFKQLIQMLEES